MNLEFRHIFKKHFKYFKIFQSLGISLGSVWKTSLLSCMYLADSFSDPKPESKSYSSPKPPWLPQTLTPFFSPAAATVPPACFVVSITHIPYIEIICISLLLLDSKPVEEESRSSLNYMNKPHIISHMTDLIFSLALSGGGMLRET